MLGALYFINVDIVRNYWNQLEQWVYDSYELLIEQKEGVMGIEN